MTSLDLNQVILNHFPQVGISFIFGYGSKVVPQLTERKSSDQVDIIVAVDSPADWHRENLKLNEHHYSFLKYLPNNVNIITKVQERYGSRVYFNPFASLANISVKYGIIKTDHLIEDLSTWDKLYVAGRLHKPVEIIINASESNDRFKSALKFNMESALRAAMLLLPESFDTLVLYKTIAGLSYNGDLRMLFGEDKNKVKNIVEAQRERFDQLYLPMIKQNQTFKESLQWNASKQTFTQDLHPKTIYRQLKLLPCNVRRTLCENHSSKARSIESDAILSSISRSIHCDKILAQAIVGIVRRSSLSQSFKGLMTAGIVKSLKYSQRKLAKSLASRMN